ncbi:MAG: aminotransferase class V-fold PLP-dependent enzyme [Lachnospiraceae bacterium]|nr:aminotransferase class V-fold PLP-dependent enzyme [Lachnospiraceae bacterium]
MGILLEKLTTYGNSDFYPYHMPGHKRQQCGAIPEAWIAVDITEIDGFDNLHQAEAILKEVQERAAKAYGAEESFYLVNGSTCGILSAISATVPFDGEILIVRNCHKSVYHGAYLRHAKLHYIYPRQVEGYDLCEAVTPEQVGEALAQYPNVSAVLIVSPTYEGRIADVAAIAEMVHEKGIPLIVDEAHGAHLGFVSEFATNSARLGADIVINSVHKTLSAMTQTALLHVNGSIVDRDRLKRFLRIYQSSSPSYVLMSSIEEAVAQAEQKTIFHTFLQNWEKLLTDLSQLQRLKILPKSLDACVKKQHDIGKLVISVKGTELSGQELYDILLKEYHLQAEMVCESYVLCMFTVGDTKEGYERLEKALIEIDGRIQEGNKKELCMMPCMETRKPFHEAWDMEKEAIALTDATGRLAGDFINLYPPGTPIAVPGECLTREVIGMLQEYLAEGLEVQGIYEGAQIMVLREKGCK